MTTLQKFPVIAQEIDGLPGQRFALIVDEAHSSQAGEGAQGLKDVLAASSLEDAESKESGDQTSEEEELDNIALAQMARRRQPTNVSTFAFTATPKPKTLELFGVRRPDGSFGPFHLYSMRQAIEEGFILDILESYTTYRAYWRLFKKIEDDPRYDKTKAAYLLRSFVDIHRHAIDQKVRIMVEHFTSKSQSEISGKAKAMIATRSRLHAVRYKLAVDRYLGELGNPFKALVAFSGTVQDGGQSYTETSMNRIPEAQTARTFESPEYRMLIVANKFQTGFDQPLLHTMYVDKKLGGVNAVQTLSRLNRTHPDKVATMVLDFTNESDDIQAAFQPYFETTLLSEATDPNLLYEIQTRLKTFPVFVDDDVERLRTSLLRQGSFVGSAIRRSCSRGNTIHWTSGKRTAGLSRPGDRLCAVVLVSGPGAHLPGRRLGEALRIRSDICEGCFPLSVKSCHARFSKTSTWNRTVSSRPAAKRSHWNERETSSVP